mmetsp:Transcript_11668/g.15227  ORF Transcript_11668/g.15227 Transcript_11668/m.15227 type:complete len:341 (-) Transcript_11668:251-1273(-)
MIPQNIGVGMITQRLKCLAMLAITFFALSSIDASVFVASFKRRGRKGGNDFMFSAIPCRDGICKVPRRNGEEEYDIQYRIFRPMNLSSQQAAPVVVLHGGPSVPSDYLEPLVDVIPYRSVIFYDQLGCGRSDEPDDPDLYSIDFAVNDLEILLSTLNVRRFHLYGQSFGGILAFEFLKKLASEESVNDVKCLSVVLSSSPTNVKQVEDEANRLVKEVMETIEDESGIQEAFRKVHQCRTSVMPEPLQKAYASAGNTFRGTSAISDYIANSPKPEAKRMPSAMVMRGEHDFVTEICLKDWKNLFNHKFVRMKVLENCSHHGLLENANDYGSIVDSFFAEYD